jgi:hypothetical protein
VVSFTSRPLYPPGKELLVPIGWEAVWAPGPVWTTWRKFLTLLGLELRPLGHPTRNICYTVCAIPTPYIATYNNNIIIIIIYRKWGLASFNGPNSQLPKLVSLTNTRRRKMSNICVSAYQPTHQTPMVIPKAINREVCFRLRF